MAGEEDLAMPFPATLAAFYEAFPDEQACWAWLRQTRWPRGFACPRCGHRRSHELAARGLEQCAACRYQASVTAGTVFHGTRVALRTWFLALFFLGRHKQGISALQLQRDTGLGSYRTAWLLLHKIRSALGPKPSELLAGLVEADETYLLAPHETGRGGGRAPGRKVLVGAVVERRGPGRVRLDVLQSHSYERDLGPFVRGAIEAARTTVRTDGLDGYRPLARAGIRHERRVQGLDRSRGPRLLPASHGVFSHLKAWLRGTFRGVSRRHLRAYLDEFSYRFNSRHHDPGIAGLMLRDLLAHPPFPYARLIAERGA
jgi:transposase-like protein